LGFLNGVAAEWPIPITDLSSLALRVPARIRVMPVFVEPIELRRGRRPYAVASSSFVKHLIQLLSMTLGHHLLSLEILEGFYGLENAKVRVRERL
jgi:hypothetical protein